ncbi:hypothetical protein [Niallia sp. Krafla_26]|uniref:hypothetical protein n=1 Tax=Niallia sp. Krafla_26 TaxID=3064703 RepID=UPI003D1686B5
MPVYQMSLYCVGFNLILSVLSFFAVYFDGVLARTVSMGIWFLPPMVTFSGVLLGIGALVLKEPFIRSILAIALNIAYILVYYTIFLS